MKSVLLIGLNHLGSMLAAQFQKLGHEVLAVDIDEERVNNILPYVTDAQIGDSTNEIFLRSLGINNFDVCFVTIGEDFQSSLETTSLLKELGGKLVVSRA
ncbi:MAG: NAD-binding protein, partial [Firmicutes bacterium]|nr:NAD-binding protein [Bacillota bacterium]